jgi:hypothetical protein
MSSVIPVALGVDLPAPVIESARSVSPRLKLWTSSELARDPSLYRDAEVALIAGWHGGDVLKEARSLRWLQTVGARSPSLCHPSTRCGSCPT